MTKGTMIKSIAVLVVICIVISGALAVVNSFTAPVIEKARADRETASRMKLLPEASGFRKISLEGLPESITSAYSGQDAHGNVLGYVFTAGHKGFDGTMAFEPHGDVWTGDREAAGVRYSVKYMREIMI